MTNRRCLAVALISALASCREPINSGIVVGKDFKAQHKWTTLINCGKGLMPITQNVPARWLLLIRESDEREGWVDVSQEMHDAMDIGARWTR